MSYRILFIGGNNQWFEGVGEKNTNIEAISFGGVLPHLEYEFYGHIASHQMIEAILEADPKKFDAIVIGCFYDPGLRELRELLEIPVIGVGEATLHMANMLTADKFSILVGRRKWIPKMQDNARNFGFDSRIASWRELGLSVHEMGNHRKTKKAILREAKAAISEDRAEVICLGCTGMVGLANEIQKEIKVPVLDPVVMGIKVAEMKASIRKKFGISHSKIGGYETPPLEDLNIILKDIYGKGIAIN